MEHQNLCPTGGGAGLRWRDWLPSGHQSLTGCWPLQRCLTLRESRHLAPGPTSHPISGIVSPAAQEFPGKRKRCWSAMAPPASLATGSWCIGLGLWPLKPFPGVSTVQTSSPWLAPGGRAQGRTPLGTCLFLGRVHQSLTALGALLGLSSQTWGRAGTPALRRKHLVPSLPFSLLSLPYHHQPSKSDPKNVIVEPMLEISHWAMPSSPGSGPTFQPLAAWNAGSHFAGTADLDTAVPGLHWHPESRQRLSLEEESLD